MSLYSGTPYWPFTRPNPPAYPALAGSAACRVLVVGGGMTGILCGYMLARSGVDTVLIERDTIASGSTAANTGLIQYSNDISLTALASQIGETDAVRFYRACKDAIGHLAQIAQTLPRDVGFKRRSSLYFASSEADVPALRREFEALDRHGFGAEWWDEARIAAAFPFRKAGAIVTHGDAELNPFRFTTTLAETAAAEGLAIYERTPLVSVSGTRGSFVARTDRADIRAERIVYAVGYSPETAGGRWLRAKLGRSYAIATKPLPGLPGWHQRFLLWETARPYLYLRTTPDRRIVAGGLDEPVRPPVSSAAELRERSLRLLAEIRKLFPGLALEPDKMWCATFGESADNLPWFGEDLERPGQYFALGYGGNGTVYSVIGAAIIRDLVLGADHPLARLVRPDRPAPAGASAPLPAGG